MRTASIVIALAGPALLGLAGPPVAARIPPRQATWLLSVCAALAALGATAVLALLGFVLVGQLHAVAGLGHWSSSVLRDDAPAEPGVGAASLLVLLVAVVGVVVVTFRHVSAIRSAYRTSRTLPGPVGGLVVVGEAPAAAIAVPGRPGRVVVSRPLLAALSGRERRALLAHESAHLAHGHHWHRSVVALAAAAYPPLAPLRGAVLQATERWADEEAAVAIGDRRGVAAALARAARVTGGSPVPATAELAAAAHAVPVRIAALLGHPPRSRPVLSLLVAATVLLGLVAAAVVLAETENLFELAGRVYRTAHGS